MYPNSASDLHSIRQILSNTIRLQMTAEESLLSDIVRELNLDYHARTGKNPSTSPRHLSFGFSSPTNVVELATLLSVDKIIYDLGKKIHRRLKGTDRKRISIQTPYGSCTFESGDDLSLKEVRGQLKKICN